MNSESQISKKKLLLFSDEYKNDKALSVILNSNLFHVQVEKIDDLHKNILNYPTPDLFIIALTSLSFEYLTICRVIRDHYCVPIIIFVETPNETLQILGLELGFGDILTRPLSGKLLLAKIRYFIRLNEKLLD